MAGVFMCGLFARFRTALQNGLWNLPHEWDDNCRGALKGVDDCSNVVHKISQPEIVGCPRMRFNTVEPLISFWPTIETVRLGRLLVSLDCVFDASLVSQT